MCNRKEAIVYCATEIQLIQNINKRKIEKIKLKYAKKYSLNKAIRNSELLPYIKNKHIENFLKKRAVRSLSGITVVAIMNKPSPCPGHCIYCPGGLENNSPKSYTGFEPAALRAKQLGYDPYLQVRTRLSQLDQTGHDTEKCELIVMGGTFNYLPYSYQEQFVKRALDAFNGKLSVDLLQAQKINETAKHRVIGITFETRPDYCSEFQIRRMLNLGVTRVEIGVQTLSDRVYAKVKRGHKVSDVISATKNLKNAFLKVGYHMMPGLFVTPDEDLKMLKELFRNDNFRPDTLKIYPTLVMPGTELYTLWKKGEFKLYSTEQIVKLLAKFKENIPPYVRIMRIERDIPTNLVAAGIKKSNLRELVHKEMQKNGKKCNCIRCREFALRERFGEKLDRASINLKRFDYEASGGHEVFLSFEDKNNLLVAYIRLRIADSLAGVRELRVVGPSLQIGERRGGAAQHEGFGSRLLSEAEKITREEFGIDTLLITSGIGAREYYRKSGYQLSGYYMKKILK